MKTCTACKLDKPLGSFGVRKASKDGRAYKCKACQSEYDKLRAGTAERRETAKLSSRRYVEANRDAHRARVRDWASRNKGARAATAAKRRAAKLQRTPAWADHDAIAFVYHCADVIGQVYGKKPDVDHIIPLQGDTVSGLHVASNLQLLSVTENRRKGNRHD